LRYVEAAVVEGAFPVQPLLGMSFLGMLDMQRSGNQMELRSR
jgi:predicted aspartyl protease